MKRILILMAVILPLSCTTEKKCAKRFPCSIPGRDSIYIQTVAQDTHYIKGETMILLSEAPCDDFELMTENDRLKAEITTLNKKLTATFTVKADTVYSLKTNTITEVKYVPQKVEVKFVPLVYKIASLIGLSAVIFLVSLLVNYIYKLKKK